MTRYFYTDPLAAAWMTKHFGMRLIRQTTSEEGTWVDDDLVLEMRHLTVHMNYVPNPDISHVYLIHPDSLRLLEPKEGDAVEYTFTPPGSRRLLGEVTFVSKFNLEISWGGDDGDDSSGWSPHHRIIQRDGKPFHWPEAEQ